MSETTTKPSICLVMIVKNESAVIRRCLDSVAKYIKYWVIVDTGSTDGTQEIITSYMDELGIPGQLFNSTWKDFGTNRTESLQLSAGKCDYQLIIDADDVLEVDNDNVFDNLIMDSYKILIKLNEMSYKRIQLIRSSLKWKYVGVLHEYLAFDGEGEISEGELVNVRMIASVSGHTKDIKGPAKYYNDALIFEKELATNKDLDPSLEARYWFYAAQSYRDAGSYDRAIECYQKRISLGFWDEEIYISKLNIAKIKTVLRKPIEEVERDFMQAWEYRPIRLEAAHELMRILIYQKRYFLAFSIGHICTKIGGCNDILFVQHDIWKWRFLDEYSIACFHTGNIHEAIKCLKTIIDSENWAGIPTDEQERINKNLEEFQKALDSMDQPVQPPVQP